MFDLKDQLLKGDHSLRSRIIERHAQMLARWRTLRETSEAREIRLMEMYARCKKVDELLAKFARKAVALHLWCHKAEKNLISPVRCKSIEELFILRKTFSQFSATLCNIRVEFDELDMLDAKLRSLENVPSNPYTHLTVVSLQDIWKNLINKVNRREEEINKETIRHEEIAKVRATFEFHRFSWLICIPMFALLRFR